DPQAMLRWLGKSGRASERQLFLVTAGCLRRFWPSLQAEKCRAVEVLERFADGLATHDQLHAASVIVFVLTASEAGAPVGDRIAAAVIALTQSLSQFAVPICSPYAIWKAAESGERAAQAALLRDLFGPLPFRPPPLAPSVLRWNGGTVKRLAEEAYSPGGG
ncbi:MAG: hypothetical protein ACJ8DJ_06185, partial [Gemmatimonadales bacterium]